MDDLFSAWWKAQKSKNKDANFVSKLASKGGGAYRIRTGDLYNANVAR